MTRYFDGAYSLRVTLCSRACAYNLAKQLIKVIVCRFLRGTQNAVQILQVDLREEKTERKVKQIRKKGQEVRRMFGWGSPCRQRGRKF